MQFRVARSATGILVAIVVSLLLAACGGSKLRPDASVRVPAALPAAPSTWPPYPRYPSSACWMRRQTGFGMIRVAPSVSLRGPLRHRRSAAVVASVLARLGDHRYVRRVVLAPVPIHARRHAKGYFAGVEPPPDALWGYISVRPGSMVAAWEGQLVAGAIRDGLCANGGPPLVAWSVGRSGGGFSESVFPFEQRFPNPSAATYRRRVRLVARRYGFRIATLRLLHPFQVAPLLIVRTDRPRRQFTADIPAILSALDPQNGEAATFEGFYFEARDGKGPFVRTEQVSRGTLEGGQWAADRDDYPFPHG
jgi:hypothetical protein